VLLSLLACTDPPPPPLRTGVTKLAWYTSVDGETWTRQAPLREKVASLGLSVRDDGQLWITFLDHQGEAGWKERLFGPPIAGMVWDGAWTPMEWSVSDDDAPALVDPQWYGDTLYYVAFDGTGDPAEGKTRIRSSDGTTWLEGQGLADPMPVTHDGVFSLFVTRHPGQVVQFTGDPLTETHSFQASVPHALVVGDALWLVVQRGPRRTPHRAIFQDGRWGPLEQLVDAPHCTSPVVGPTDEGFVLLCVEETLPP